MQFAARADVGFRFSRSLAGAFALVWLGGTGCGDGQHTADPKSMEPGSIHEADAGNAPQADAGGAQQHDGGTSVGKDAAVTPDNDAGTGDGDGDADAGSSNPCDGCLIEGVCYPSGARSSAAGCMVCDPTRSQSAFSPADGLTCDDGNLCTDDDACVAGICQGTAKDCSDGVTCNGEETCAADSGECQPATSTCDEGMYCNAQTDTCDAICLGCRIDGVCVPKGAPHPSDACLACDPAQSTIAYSPAPGALCGSASECATGGHCDVKGACVLDGLPEGKECGAEPTECAKFACDGLGACAPDYTASGTSCGQHGVCEAQDTCDGKGACSDRGQLALGDTCMPNGVCSGDASAPVCGCAQGFELVQGACVDIDECARGLDSCDHAPDACVNTPGSYTCACPGSATGSGQGADGCACARADWSPTCSPWTSLALKNQHACAISDGRLYCWGRGDSGELGLGDYSSRARPTRVGSDSDWLSVSTGPDHSCGIRHGGELYCWGRNAVYALGLGDQLPRLTPTRVGSDADWTQVTTGNQYTCALRGEGVVYCWGYNDDGGLGMGWGPAVQTPKQVWEVTGIERVVAGRTHTCILRQGQIYCWGDNFSGQLGDGTSTDNPKPTGVTAYSDFVDVTAAFNITCGRRQNGELYCWGRAAEGSHTGWGPRRTGTDSDWTSVSSGSALWCGTRAGGVGYCWGDGYSGELGADFLGHLNGPTMQLAGGGAWDVLQPGTGSVCGLKDGGLYCWGNNDWGLRGTGFGLSRMGESSDFTSVSTSPLSSCAINQNHELYCWGQRFDTTTTNIVTVATPTRVGDASDWLAVATGADTYLFYACGIRAPGDLYCWGWGQVAGGANTSEKVMEPRLMGDVHDYVSVRAFAQHACAIRATGDMQCWGNNTYGQLGDATSTRHLLPGPVKETGWTEVSVGSMHTCGLIGSEPYCWGNGFQGQVGVTLPSNATNQLVPLHLDGAPKFSEIATGTSHSCAVSDGALYCWGANSAGQLGLPVAPKVMAPTRVDGVADLHGLALGDTHGCALRGEEGALTCWGGNASGQLGTDSAQNWLNVGEASGWQAVSSSLSHSCALHEGEIYCFGSGIEKQLNFTPGRTPQGVLQDFSK